MTAARLWPDGNASCPEHGELCAYSGMEPDRCPWCHSTWQAIHHAGSHSCEQAKVWHDGRSPDNAARKAWRVDTARRMRENALQSPHKGGQSDLSACPGTEPQVDAGTLPHPENRSEPVCGGSGVPSGWSIAGASQVPAEPAGEDYGAGEASPYDTASSDVAQEQAG